MKYIVVLVFFFITSITHAQVLAHFSVQINEDRINSPVSVYLDNINYNTDKGELALYELTSSGEKEIPCQLEAGHSARLWFILEGSTIKNSVREFVIKLKEKGMATPLELTIKKDHQDLTFIENDNPVLSYRFGITYPPAGIDPIYKRSGFIHPLWSPHGEILTRIQAPDHYHHYGIWGPWTITHIGDRLVDFWNLAEGMGTVKFAGFLSENEGPVFTAFKALQQHIDFGTKGEDQVAINEILDVRVWNVEENVWIIDYTTTINSPLENGIMLDAYRYGGGIGFRATEKWTKDNSTVLTSDNKTRIDADGSFAKWCIVEGESAVNQGRSGIVFLSHPSNRMHPEPMRVWPIDQNGRGDLYFEFVPIRHEDWKLTQNKDYTLKYRMIVFDGNFDAATAEKYWNSFASNPLITFK